jgi:hypothetical protein
MKRVLKWRVPIDGRPHAIGAGKVVHIDTQIQEPPDVVLVWTLETGARAVSPSRQALVVGTGHIEVPDGWKPLGSAKVNSGQIMWHVFGEPQ